MADKKTDSSSEAQENQTESLKASEKKKLEIVKSHLLAPATGLEDYGFWWTEMLKEHAKKTNSENQDFRRGRIWS